MQLYTDTQPGPCVTYPVDSCRLITSADCQQELETVTAGSVWIK